ncbi:MAG: threonine synthase [Clostridia bacterium]|nr:threonine synthase [Clostridia bacterium]
MEYVSTRGACAVTSAQAIVRGIAPDGGLYVPTSLPRFSMEEIRSLTPLSYPERAGRVLAALLPDFSAEELTRMAMEAYARFETESPAPLRKLKNGVRVLELFHGPTMAFKDMALQMLPRLMRAASVKTGETREIAILTATSGDTGKAALEGFADAPGTSVTVFYPLGGVSRIQERQMVTSRGRNTHVIAVRGNFDDAQTGVKRLFADEAFNRAMHDSGRVLSSANSINLGRLAPQVAYYFSACADLLGEGLIDENHPLNVCVPTGNFGNILACWYAKRMGAPIGRLICASNANDVLTQFLSTGVYDRRRTFKKTISPSMDILISSNLERLLYEIGGAEKVRGWMRSLSEEGVFALDEADFAAIHAHFLCGACDDEGTREEIAAVWREDGYVLDPHTAVASHVLRAVADRSQPSLLVSTASPFKFGPDVCAALGIACDPEDAFDAADKLRAATGLAVPEPLSALRDLPVRHERVCDREDMGEAVLLDLKENKK